jgi:hypothetical protein
MSFALLPDEAALSIFKQMGPITLLRVASVSRRFCALAHDDACWRRHWDRVFASLRFMDKYLEERKNTMPLWKNYQIMFLAPPSETHGELAKLRRDMCVLAMLDLPSGYNLRVKDNTEQDTQNVHWSLLVTMPGVFKMLIHEHKWEHWICTPQYETQRGWTRIKVSLDTIEWKEWNRFYTLTRDSDCQVVAEHRPWIRFVKKQ